VSDLSLQSVYGDGTYMEDYNNGGAT